MLRSNKLDQPAEAAAQPVAGLEPLRQAHDQVDASGERLAAAAAAAAIAQLKLPIDELALELEPPGQAGAGGAAGQMAMGDRAGQARGGGFAVRGDHEQLHQAVDHIEAPGKRLTRRRPRRDRAAASRRRRARAQARGAWPARRRRRRWPFGERVQLDQRGGPAQRRPPQAS